ncbi:hypothetical protein AB6A40_003754 [Gnathostoma spinigerum]|uniref:nicotinamidase n=1 Tax=Gnathostoma spinigerum TaxID=75299 RepID=A0ABD6EAI4_9BILA
MQPLITVENGFTKHQFISEFVRATNNTVNLDVIDELFDRLDMDHDGQLNDTECWRANREIIGQFSRLRVALIVVDFQNDFVSGSMAIKAGSAHQNPNEALFNINELLKDTIFSLVVYTMDWHPQNHISFWEHCRNSDRVLSEIDRGRQLMPFDTVSFDEPKCTQTLYPSHCVQNSWGAALDQHLIHIDNAVYVKKGQDQYADSYSAFMDNYGLKKTKLESILCEHQIGAILVCGLAYDICVAATCRDGFDCGFLTALIADCSKAFNKDGEQQTNNELLKKNVAIVTSWEARKIARGQLIPGEWISAIVNKFLMKNCNQKDEILEEDELIRELRNKNGNRHF